MLNTQIRHCKVEETEALATNQSIKTLKRKYHIKMKRRKRRNSVIFHRPQMMALLQPSPACNSPSKMRIFHHRKDQRQAMKMDDLLPAFRFSSFSQLQQNTKTWPSVRYLLVFTFVLSLLFERILLLTLSIVFIYIM